MSCRGIRNKRRDQGNAVIEFVVVGVLVLIPLSFLAMCVMRVQAASVASSLAVREAGRAFVSSDDVMQAQTRAVAAASLALADQGFALPPRALRVSCSTGQCLAPESTVRVELDWAVELPWLPEFLGKERTSIQITAERVMPVDTYRGEQ